MNYSNRKLRNMRSTSVVPQPDGTAVYYHSTAVVLRRNDGRFVLNSGGYQTSTTKTRINQFTPPGCRLFQRNHEWFVGSVPFFDGMILDSDGSPINGTGKEI